MRVYVPLEAVVALAIVELPCEAVTQIPPTAAPPTDAVTVPAIVPPAAIDALMLGVVEPAATATVVAVEADDALLYH